MNILKELASIIIRHRNIQIEIVDTNISNGKKNKLLDFYHNLISDRFEDDQDAAFHLYGSSSTDERYRQLKSRLRKRLLNTIFFLDANLSSSPDYDQALLHCEKEWALVQILRYHQAGLTAFKLANNVFRTALRYHLTPIIVECARLLRAYAAQRNDTRAFEQYNQYLNDYLSKLTGEIQSEEILQLVNQFYHKPPQKNKDLELSDHQLDTYCNQLLSLSEKFDVPVINFNMFLAWSIRYELERNYEDMLEVCEKAEAYLNAHPHFSTTERFVAIQIKKMSAYLHTLAFKKGKENIEKNLHTAVRGSALWFTFLEYYLLLALHSENYISALAIYKEVATDANFPRMRSDEADKWLVFEVCLRYLTENYELKSAVFRHRKKYPTDVDQFIDTPYDFPREEANLNLQLTAVQILLLLEQRNLRKVGEKIKHLHKSTLPMLKRDPNERPLHFLRLLQQLVRADFQMEELTDKNRHLQRLQATPFSYRGRITDLEVIPYEKIWQLITAHLS